MNTIWPFWPSPRVNTSTPGFMKFTIVVKGSLGPHNYEFSFSYSRVEVEKNLKSIYVY